MSQQSDKHPPVTEHPRPTQRERPARHIYIYGFSLRVVARVSTSLEIGGNKDVVSILVLSVHVEFVIGHEVRNALSAGGSGVLHLDGKLAMGGWKLFPITQPPPVMS